MIGSQMGRVATAEKMSVAQLQESLQNKTLPAYIAIPLIEEKLNMESRMRAMQALQKAQEPRVPISEQVMQRAATEEGIDALPTNLAPTGMAGGGIVAFANEGLVQDGFSGLPEDFVRRTLPLAQRIAKDRNVPVEAVLGQLGLETGWGTKVIADTYNLGNIKVRRGQNGVIATDNQTGEVGKYAKYPSYDAFGERFSNLLGTNQYEGVIGTSNAKDYFDALSKAGYAEDENYTKKGVEVSDQVARILAKMDGAKTQAPITLPKSWEGRLAQPLAAREAQPTNDGARGFLDFPPVSREIPKQLRMPKMGDAEGVFTPVREGVGVVGSYLSRVPEDALWFLRHTGALPPETPEQAGPPKPGAGDTRDYAKVAPNKAAEKAPDYFASIDALTSKYLANQEARDTALQQKIAANKMEGTAFSDYEKLLRADRAEVAADRESAKGMALFKAGLAMMAGTSPRALENIGKGAMVGAEDYQISRKEARAAERENNKAMALIEQARRAEARGDLDKKNDLLTRAAENQKDAEKILLSSELEKAKIGATLAAASGRGGLTQNNIMTMMRNIEKDFPFEEFWSTSQTIKAMRNPPKIGDNPEIDAKVRREYDARNLNKLLSYANPFGGMGNTYSSGLDDASVTQE